MDGKNKSAALAAAAGQATGETPVKERIFSLIKKLENESVTNERPE